MLNKFFSYERELFLLLSNKYKLKNYSMFTIKNISLKILNYINSIITKFKIKITKRRAIEIVWVIGSIASIIWLLIYFFPNNSGNKIEKELYSNIIFDYQWAWVEKIKESFWVPFNEYKNFEWIDKYFYRLRNWTIEFGWWIRIELNSDSDVEVLLPVFYNRWPWHKNIIFWDSTFKDVCDNYSVNKITSSWWSMSNAKYTEIEFYTWNFWQYQTYTFWTHYTTWESYELGESYRYIEDNKDIIEKCLEYSDKQFDYLIIN